MQISFLGLLKKFLRFFWGGITNSFENNHDYIYS